MILVANLQFNRQAKIIFEYEAPNPYLYTFNGTAIFQDGDKTPLDAGCFVLRGCSLRNTDWVYGLIAYTGYKIC